MTPHPESEHEKECHIVTKLLGECKKHAGYCPCTCKTPPDEGKNCSENKNCDGKCCQHTEGEWEETRKEFEVWYNEGMLDKREEEIANWWLDQMEKALSSQAEAYERIEVTVDISDELRQYAGVLSLALQNLGIMDIGYKERRVIDALVTGMSDFSDRYAKKVAEKYTAALAIIREQFGEVKKNI